jgi:hypothetical protein
MITFSAFALPTLPGGFHEAASFAASEDGRTDGSRNGLSCLLDLILANGTGRAGTGDQQG